MRTTRALTRATTVSVTNGGGARISTSQEADVGLSYAQQLNAQLPIVRDPEVNVSINRRGDSLSVLADDRGRTMPGPALPSEAGPLT